jgi:hypothetical protein
MQRKIKKELFEDIQATAKKTAKAIKMYVIFIVLRETKRLHGKTFLNVHAEKVVLHKKGSPSPRGSVT